MPDQPLNVTSVLDAMHYLAPLPEMNPVMLVECMRTNGYARHGL